MAGRVRTSQIEFILGIDGRSPNKSTPQSQFQPSLDHLIYPAFPTQHHGSEHVVQLPIRNTPSGIAAAMANA